MSLTGLRYSILVEGSGCVLPALGPTGPVPRSAGRWTAVVAAPIPLDPAPPGLALPIPALFAPGGYALALVAGGLAAYAVVVCASDELFEVEPTVEPLSAGGAVEVGPLKCIGFCPETISGVNT